MARDKFEEYLKEKVRQREISPSNDAWNRIAEQLPVHERKNRKPLLWYGIAASFVGILVIGLYVMLSTKEDLAPPMEAVAEEAKPETTTEILKPELVPGDLDPEEMVVSREPVQSSKQLTPVVTEAEETELFSQNEPELTVAINPETVVSPIPEVEPQQEDLILETKISEVVAEVRLLEQNSGVLSEAEVDSLLWKAQSEILNDKLFNADRSVDAMALLYEVEEELDRSFRDQIFERLKTGFMKVRTAVADRNN